MAKYNDLEKYTFEYLLDTALSYVDDNLDKRKGSYIYDAIAPAMYKLAEVVLDIGGSIKSTFLPFAGGEDLDNIAMFAGAPRFQATTGQMRAEISGTDGAEVPVQLGMKFNSIDSDPLITYEVIKKLDETNYILEPDIEGNIGTAYIGNIATQQFVEGLKSAVVMETYLLARDYEDDDAFRQRLISITNRSPFGGNVADYNRLIREVDGVGEVQVYPVWDGGGTVKISVIGVNHSPVSVGKVTEIQNLVDPSPQGLGKGLAPIGHTVTVTTPDEKVVNVSATLTLSEGVALGQISGEVIENIDSYISGLRVAWGVESSLLNYNCDVLRVKIMEAITSVSGVVNVTNVTLNGSTNDLMLTQTATKQEIPILGTVTLI